MRRAFTALAAGAVLCTGAASQAALTIDEQTILSGGGLLTNQLVGFNWRILNAASNGVIPIPATPTGTATDMIRMFTNGNTNNPVGTPAIPWNAANASTFNVTGFGVGGVPTSTSELYYGLDFDRGPQQTLTLGAVTTVATIANFLQTQTGLAATDPVMPVFGFDQNQIANDPDLFIRARLHLVDPGLISIGMTPAQIDAALAGATAAQIRTLTFNDTGTAGFPSAPPGFPVPTPPGVPQYFSQDDSVLALDDDAWDYLPGTLTLDNTTFPQLSLGGDIVNLGPHTVDNNTAGNNADWGGYFIDLQRPRTGSPFPFWEPLDLLSVMANDGITPVNTDWVFMLELQAAGDNNGKEEAYILGVLRPVPTEPPGPAIPEPLTAATALLSTLALAGAALRRR